MSEKRSIPLTQYWDLTLLRELPILKGRRRFEARCVCGKVKEVDGHHVVRGNIRSCGCGKNRHFRKRPFESIYNIFVKRCGHNVDLTYEEFLSFTGKPCHYCGDHLDWESQRYSVRSSKWFLDRKNNALGYSKKNCVACCKTCNYAKGARYSYREWKAMAKVLKEIRNG
jgi:hypothetical protein